MVNPWGLLIVALGVGLILATLTGHTSSVIKAFQGTP